MMEKENKNTLQRPPKTARLEKRKPMEKGPIGTHVATKVIGWYVASESDRLARRVGVVILSLVW